MPFAFRNLRAVNLWTTTVIAHRSSAWFKEALNFRQKSIFLLNQCNPSPITVEPISINVVSLILGTDYCLLSDRISRLLLRLDTSSERKVVVGWSNSENIFLCNFLSDKCIFLKYVSVALSLPFLYRFPSETLMPSSTFGYFSLLFLAFLAVRLCYYKLPYFLIQASSFSFTILSWCHNNDQYYRNLDISRNTWPT